LTATNSSQNVAETIVVANFRVLVMWRRIAGLRCQETGFGYQVAFETANMPPPEVVMILLPLNE